MCNCLKGEGVVRSTVPALVKCEMPLHETHHWENYVRAAVQDDQTEAQTLQGVLVLCPRNLPPPPSLPARSTRRCFSNFYIAHSGGRVHVPRAAIVRNHQTEPLASKANFCTGCNSLNCCIGWETPCPCDIIVLAARDEQGFQQHGWYARFSKEPNRLRRLPQPIVKSVWQYMYSIPELKTSSLNSDFLDAFFAAPTVDFESVAIVRYQRLNEIVATLTDSRGSKRKREPSSVPPSAPASPARTAVAGHCTVCLEDDVELSDKQCCGTQGATCVDCHARLRHNCPVCDRTNLNAQYKCLVCNSLLPLSKYGFPCACCKRCNICVGCFSEFEECIECDPVRDVER